MSSLRSQLMAVATLAAASLTSAVGPVRRHAAREHGRDRLRNVRRKNDWLVLLLMRNAKPD